MKSLPTDERGTALGGEIDAARELYQSGDSLVTVGARLVVSSGTILNLLRQAGVQTRAVGTNQWSPG